MLMHESIVHYFLLLTRCSTARIYHNLIIHPPVNEHLGCFQFLAIANKAAVNMYL